MCLISGYDEEELLGEHLYKFLPEEDVILNPLRFSELMQGKTLLHERRLLRKDGTVLEIEVNSKMASTHTFIGFIRDISERKHAEEKIKKSNERFEIIAQATNDAVWDHDFINNETWGNKKLYSLYGLVSGTEKIKFEMFLERIHPGDRKRIRDHLDAAIAKSEISVAEEFRFKTADGSYRYYYDRAYIEYDESGKPLRILGAMQDITERKRSEKAMRESEERYRALVENAPEALFVFNPANQRFVSVSESATRLFKMTTEELLQIGPVTVSPKYQPDGRLSEEAAKDYINKAINGEKPTFEWEHCDKLGNRVPCEIWLVKLPSENEVLIRGSIVDISERKKAAEDLYRSEQKYRLLFYNNPQPMWMVNIPDLKIIDVNEAAINQYGYSKQEFLQLSALDLRPDEDKENFIKELDTMDPARINVKAWRHKKKEGTIIYVETYTHQVMYEGRLVWLGLSHDVTEKYKAKELLQKSYEDIRQLAINLQNIRENERTKIAREIHDELGQQLTGLKMDIHWLSGKLKNSGKEIYNKLQESMELINTTIVSVRKIATDLRPSILDDLGLVAALEWQGQEFEKRSGIRVKFINRVGELPVNPDASTAVFRIYQELLTNIARHAHAELVSTSLNIYQNSLILSVTDNGEGFDANAISYKKTLGLLGIKERTSLIGGTYEIKTLPGEGTEVSITIPVDLIRINV